jgi:hypothetical protein
MIRIGIEKPGDGDFSKRIAAHDEPRIYSHAALWFAPDLVCEAHYDFGVRFRHYAPDPSRWTSGR